MRHNVLDLVRQRHIGTPYQVKPTVVASALKIFNQKVYCTTNDFSTAVLEIISLFTTWRERAISNAHIKGHIYLYVHIYCLYHRMFIQVKVH